MTTTKAPPLGLICPKCHAKLKTTRTVRRADHSTQREKRCLNSKCGYRTLSFERLAHEDHRALQLSVSAVNPA